MHIQLMKYKTGTYTVKPRPLCSGGFDRRSSTAAVTVAVLRQHWQALLRLLQ